MTADTSETINEESSAENESEQASREDKRACQLIIKERMGRIARWLHLRFPRIFPRLRKKQILVYERQRDEQENIETCPPVDEQISLQSLTVSEFYGPAQIESLYDNLQRFKLHERYPGSSDAVEWIRSRRGNLTYGGWYNLGLLARPDDKPHFVQRKSIDLPDEVDHAYGEIFCLTPSLTCVVVTFIYKDDCSLCFDQALREKYETTLKRTKHSYHINSPRFAKQDRVERIRQELTLVASNWISKHIPGMYSEKFPDEKHPILEFITLCKAKPFPEKRLDYLDALDLNSNAEVWRSTGVDSLTFTSLTTSRSGVSSACLAVNISSFNSIDLSTWGGKTRRGFINYLSHDMSYLMSRWALLALTRSLDGELQIFRDEMFGPTKHSMLPKRQITVISKFIGSDFDRTLISRDIERFTKDKSFFLHDLPELIHTYEHLDLPIRKLAQSLREQLEVQAQTLIATNQAMSSLISQAGSALSAAESIRLQHRVEWMTWIMLFLTIVATVATTISAQDSISKIMPELSLNRSVEKPVSSTPIHSEQPSHK